MPVFVHFTFRLTNQWLFLREDWLLQSHWSRMENADDDDYGYFNDDFGYVDD